MHSNKIHQLIMSSSTSNQTIGEIIYNELQEPDLEIHSDEKAWLYLDCSRSNADQILMGRPDGTFLVRRSRIGQYALSIM